MFYSYFLSRVRSVRFCPTAGGFQWSVFTFTRTCQSHGIEKKSAVYYVYIGWRKKLGQLGQKDQVSNILQSTVATRPRLCGGTLMMTLLQIHCWICRWKNFDNRPVFREVTDKSRVSPFWLTVATGQVFFSRYRVHADVVAGFGHVRPFPPRKAFATVSPHIALEGHNTTLRCFFYGKYAVSCQMKHNKRQSAVLTTV